MMFAGYRLRLLGTLALAACLQAQPGAPPASPTQAAAAAQPSNDEVVKKIDDLMWHAQLDDIAVIDKIEYTSLPAAKVADPRLPGANNPLIIDSIAQLTAGLKPFPEEKLPPASAPVAAAPQPEQPIAVAPPVVTNTPPPSTPESSGPLTVNEKKFNSRKKNLQTVIPFSPNKTIELRFYDNAAIDGDSIASSSTAISCASISCSVASPRS